MGKKNNKNWIRKLLRMSVVYILLGLKEMIRVE